MQGIFGATATASIIVFYYGLCSEGGYPLVLSKTDIYLLIAMGMVGASSQCLYIEALKLESATRVSCLFILSIAVGFSTDFLFLGYPLQMMQVLGTLMIILSSVLIFVLKSD